MERLERSPSRHQRSGAALPRCGRSTKSAASSASLRSVLRGVPIRARMVRPRAKSMSWLARMSTGKSDGISPALIASRKRLPTSPTAPASAFCRNRWTSTSFTSGATHSRRHPRADPFAVAVSTVCLRKAASESRRVCGERSAFAARAPFVSAYAAAHTVGLVEGRFRDVISAGEIPSDFPVDIRASQLVDFARGLTMRARIGTPRKTLLRDAEEAADLVLLPRRGNAAPER